MLKSELDEISISFNPTKSNFFFKYSYLKKHAPLSLFSFMQIDKFQMKEERIKNQFVILFQKHHKEEIRRVSI